MKSGSSPAQFNEMTAELEKRASSKRNCSKRKNRRSSAARFGNRARNPQSAKLHQSDARPSAREICPKNGKREDFEKLTAQLKTEVGESTIKSDFLRYSRPAKAKSAADRRAKSRRRFTANRRTASRRAKHKNQSVERENVPQIFGDAEFLRSVFNNLFINAVQAMEKRRRKFERQNFADDEFVKIEITDTGTEFGRKSLENFRAVFFDQRNRNGFGLGDCQKIVDDHNGTIDVESN
jgi:nitrogen fixation/metabolism regulation signal transduction histidine kinase